MWSALDFLTLRRMLPYMVLRFVVLFYNCCLMILRRPECRLGSLVNMVAVSWLIVQSFGQDLSPYTGGSAHMNIMSGSLCPSTTLRAASSASSLCVTPVCDFTLPMCVLYSRVSLVLMMPSASFKRFLCGWWMKLSGSMAYFRSVLMLKARSVNIGRVGFSLFASSARVIAVGSARLIV